MRKICVIFNPAARSGKSVRVIERLSLCEKGCALWPTQEPRDAARLAKKAAEEKFDVVVAAGGDGTLNEVVNGLANAENLSSALGILPMGTVNVFARELGIPLNPQQAWQVIETGKPRAVDVLRANDRWFVAMAGVGLDARVVEATSLSLKKKIGFLAYVVAMLSLGRQLPTHLIARANGEEWRGSAVLVGNGRLYTGWMNMFPSAKLDDGKFDVCVWDGYGLWTIFGWAWHALRGSHLQNCPVKYFATTQLRVETAIGSAPFEVEGELGGHAPVDFTLSPRGLNVIAP